MKKFELIYTFKKGRGGKQAGKQFKTIKEGDSKAKISTTFCQNNPNYKTISITEIS